MSVEKPVLEEVIALCETESEKRKWFEGAAVVLKALKGINREREQAERARDQARKDRDAAVAEITTKQAASERASGLALADAERVLRQRTDAAEAEVAQARTELASVKAQTVQVRETKALEQGQLDAFRADATRETAAITARLEALRTEERDAKARFSGVAAALKG